MDAAVPATSVLFVDGRAMATVSVAPSPVHGPLSPHHGVAVPHDAVGSLLELHAQPLDAVRALSPSPATPPVRTKRKYTKRKRASTANEPAPEPTITPEDMGISFTGPLPKLVSQALQRKMARKFPREFKRWKQARHEAWWDRKYKREREERFSRWLASGTDLPPHMTRDVPTLPEAPERPEEAIAAKVEQRLVKTYRQECKCGACNRVRYERPQVDDTYVCRMSGCRQTFRDIAAFVHHQVDDHATINVHCKRTRHEYYHTQVAPLFPPETVYILFQYTNVAERPTMWTLERAETEAETLETRVAALRTNTTTMRSVPKRFIRESFKVAYERVQRYGISELKEQYRIALEHYESALVSPIGPRNRQDVISTVRIGRNWLLSPEPENADVSRVIKLEKYDGDVWKEPEAVTEEFESEDEDEEVVLFQIGDPDEATILHIEDAEQLERQSSTVHKEKRPVETSLLGAIEEPDAISV